MAAELNDLPQRNFDYACHTMLSTWTQHEFFKHLKNLIPSNSYSMFTNQRMKMSVYITSTCTHWSDWNRCDSSVYMPVYC